MEFTKPEESDSSSRSYDIAISFQTPLSITPATVWQNWFKGGYKEQDSDDSEHWREPEILLRMEDPSEGCTIGKLYICHHCSFENEDFNVLKNHIETTHTPDLKYRLETSDISKHMTQEEENEEINQNDLEILNVFNEHKFPDLKSSVGSPNPASDSSTSIDKDVKKKKFAECPHCDFRCAKVNTLKKHILLKHRDSKPFECSFCQFSTFYPKVLKRHIKSKHPCARPYSCSQCDFSCVEEGELKVHVINDHTNSQLHSCPFCSYVSSQCSALMAHVRGKHPHESFSECPHCKMRSFETPNSEQLRIVENLPLSKSIILNSFAGLQKTSRPLSKIHQCSECAYNTPQLAHLKRHVLSNHTLERPYQCRHCTYSTARSDHLRKHVVNKHSLENAFHCTHCSFTSLHATDLKFHIKLVHTDNKNAYASFNCYLHAIHQAVDKGFRCSQCNYITHSPDELRLHLAMQHSSPKCYWCSFCSFSSFQLDKLQSHFQSCHSNDNSTSSQSDSLTRNMQLPGWLDYIV